MCELKRDLVPCLRLKSYGVFSEQTPISLSNFPKMVCYRPCASACRIPGPRSVDANSAAGGRTAARNLGAESTLPSPPTSRLYLLYLFFPNHVIASPPPGLVHGITPAAQNNLGPRCAEQIPLNGPGRAVGCLWCISTEAGAGKSVGQLSGGAVPPAAHIAARPLPPIRRRNYP